MAYFLLHFLNNPAVYRRDHILRILEQLTNSVAIIRSMVRQNEYDEAQNLFAIETEKFIQTPYVQFVTDSTTNWYDAIINHYGVKLEVYEEFANLLLEGAEIAFESHRITEGFLLVTKCQRLYAHVIDNDNSYSIVRERNLERLAILISKFSN